jgi:hypothetical protein
MDPDPAADIHFHGDGNGFDADAFGAIDLD